MSNTILNTCGWCGVETTDGSDMCYYCATGEPTPEELHEQAERIHDGLREDGVNV